MAARAERAAEIERLLGQEAEAVGTTPRALVRWLRTVGVVGSPEEVRDRLDEYKRVVEAVAEIWKEKDRQISSLSR